MSQEDKKISLSEAFANAMRPPSEEEIYKAAINRTLWSIDEFSALIAGLTPESYKNGTKGNASISDEVFVKRDAYATKVFSLFLDYMEKHSTSKDFIPIDNRLFMSPWKYIKWIAENNVGMNKRFFNSLPLSLMELFYEFQPINIALRTASKYSRQYHEAFYLQNAQKILEEFPNLSPSEIYQHPYMENTERYIRQLGGNYKKRTILESWLPKIMDFSRGRPKKSKSHPTKNPVSS